jgi:hypothetical protein
LRDVGPIRQLCAILDVSRSWYYAAHAKTADAEEVALRTQREDIVLEFPGYG